MRYEIRAMSFAEILDTGFRIVRNHFVTVVGLGCLLYVPFAVVEALFPMKPGAGLRSADLIPLAVIAVVALIGGPIVSAAVTFAVGETYVGRPASLGRALRASVAMIVPLTGTMLLLGIAIVVGFILLVIPGIYAWCAFILVWPVMVLEGTFGLSALRRSRHLMRGNLLRGAGVTLVGGLIVGVLGGVLSLALGFIPVIGPVGSALARAVGAAYTSSVLVVLYFDIRCRKEAFDLDHLVALVGGAPAPEASVG